MCLISLTEVDEATAKAIWADELAQQVKDRQQQHETLKKLPPPWTVAPHIWCRIRGYNNG